MGTLPINCLSQSKIKELILSFSRVDRIKVIPVCGYNNWKDNIILMNLQAGENTGLQYLLVKRSKYSMLSIVDIVGYFSKCTTAGSKF